MERRKNLASNRPIEHTVSSKEVSIKPYALENHVTNEIFSIHRVRLSF